MDEPRMHTNQRESDLGPRRSEIPKSEAAIPEFLREIATALGTIHEIEAVAWCGSAAPSHTPRLEGSRFVVLQFYPMASRRLPGMTQRNAFTQQFCCEGAMHALR